MKLSIRDGLRPLSVAMVAFLLSGCVSTSSDGWAVITLARNGLGMGSPGRVTLETAASSPYTSIGVSVGNGNEVMLVLATDNDGEQLWTSAAKIAVVTKNGRIVRTGGLPFAQIVSSLRETMREGESSVGWVADIRDLGIFGLRVTCAVRHIGSDDITILGKILHTTLSEENCQADEKRLDWSFKNRYWRDPVTGFTWQSLQNISPRLAPLRLEVLRPPG